MFDAPLSRGGFGTAGITGKSPLKPRKLDSGGSTSTTSTVAPPANFQQAYSNLLGQATQVAQQPLQQYGGPQVAGLTPDQASAIGTINNVQGGYAPYLNAASTAFSNATTPLWSNLPQFSADQVQQYESPYTSDVVNATKAQFANQNAQTNQGIIGNAISSGAWGGDRAGVAQGIAAGQEALAQAPVIAQLENTGYNTALGEFNQQQQSELGANEANSWLNSQAGFGYGNLGQEEQNLGIAGATAQLGAGSLEQQIQQEQLNVPYEQFLQQQAYPFQTTGWLAGITEGTGSAAGSTGTTSSTTNPSLLSTLTGLGTAGLGIAGLTGGFGSNGWLTGSNGLFSDLGSLFSGSNTASTPEQISNTAGNAGLFDFLGVRRGGAIPHRAVGGHVPRRAPGGIVPPMLDLTPGGGGISSIPINLLSDYGISSQGAPPIITTYPWMHGSSPSFGASSPFSTPEDIAGMTGPGGVDYNGGGDSGAGVGISGGAVGGGSSGGIGASGTTGGSSTSSANNGFDIGGLLSGLAAMGITGLGTLGGSALGGFFGGPVGGFLGSMGGKSLGADIASALGLTSAPSLADESMANQDASLQGPSNDPDANTEAALADAQAGIASAATASPSPGNSSIDAALGGTDTSGGIGAQGGNAAAATGDVSAVGFAGGDFGDSGPGDTGSADGDGTGTGGDSGDSDGGGASASGDSGGDAGGGGGGGGGDGGGGCYITSATMAEAGKTDKAPELQTLRHYRDTVLKKTPEGRALVQHYYTVAPKIVRAIDQRGDKHVIYGVLRHHINQAVDAIRSGNHPKALESYAKMLEFAQDVAGPRYAVGGHVTALADGGEPDDGTGIGAFSAGDDDADAGGAGIAGDAGGSGPGIAAAPKDYGITGDYSNTYTPRQPTNRSADMRAIAPWLGLTAAGFGIAGGPSTSGIKNIGTGALEGLKTYAGQIQQANAAEERENEQVDTGNYRKASLDMDVKKLADAAKEARARLQQADATQTETARHNVAAEENQAQQTKQTGAYQQGVLSADQQRIKNELLTPEIKNAQWLADPNRTQAELDAYTNQMAKDAQQFTDRDNNRIRIMKNGQAQQLDPKTNTWNNITELPEMLTKVGTQGSAINMRFANRVIGAGNEGATALASIAGMGDVNSGAFGNDQSRSGSLFGAAASNYIAGNLTPERVKRYNATMAGLAPEIASAQQQGQAPSDAQIEHVEKAITILPTDDDQTRQYRVALAARYLDKALEVSDTMANPAQRKLLAGIRSKLQQFPDPDAINAAPGPGMFPGRANVGKAATEPGAAPSNGAAAPTGSGTGGTGASSPVVPVRPTGVPPAARFSPGDNSWWWKDPVSDKWQTAPAH